MKKRMTILFIILALGTATIGCSSTKNETDSNSDATASATSQPAESSDESKTTASDKKSNDTNNSNTNSSNDSNSSSSDSSSSDDSQSASPAKTITENGTHTLTGDIDGQVLVTAEEVTLVLDNVNITSTDGPAILGYYDGGKQNLTVELKGESTLTAEVKHGIQGKDDLTITGDGSVDITAEKDGIHGGSLLTIENGNINVLASNEGIEAEEIVINGGATIVHATDDGINAASDDTAITPSFLMTDGTLTIFCSSDGVDSNGTFDITGGTAAVFVNAPRDGDATDVDGSGTLTTPILYVNEAVTSGTKIAVSDFSVTTEADATAFCLILPNIKAGESYTVTADGTDLATTEATTSLQGMQGGMRGGRGAMGALPEDATGSLPEGFPEGEMGTPPEGFAQGERGTPPEGFPEGGRGGTPPEGFPENFANGDPSSMPDTNSSASSSASNETDSTTENSQTM